METAVPSKKAVELHWGLSCDSHPMLTEVVSSLREPFNPPIFVTMEHVCKWLLSKYMYNINVSNSIKYMQVKCSISVQLQENFKNNKSCW